MPSMSRERFLREYELRLQHEFDRDGQPAQWAARVSGPRFWGEEDMCIDLADKKPPIDEDRRKRLSAACSPDEKFLAISLNKRLLVYDIATGALRADVHGHEYHIEQLHFLPWAHKRASTSSAVDQSPYDADDVKYLLFVQGERESLRNGEVESFIIWRVDSEGHLLDDSVPLDVEKLKDDAMAAMSPALSAHGDVEKAETEEIRAGLASILQRIQFRVQQKHRLKHFGRMPSFDTQPFSKDGMKCLFVSNGKTTQHGMRLADDLPQIVIWDVSTRAEICALKGHTDSIMWAGWAADDQAVVTASWDETYKIWDAETGDCRHTIGPTNGQNWAGTVSPDGQYVVLSGGRPTEVAVYMVATGIKTATLIDEPGEAGRDWIRTLRWNPNEHEVVMESKRRALLMDTDTGESRVVLEYARVESNDEQIRMLNGFARWSQLFWAEERRLLVAVGSDATIYVWNTEKNCKWRFQRPQGAATDRWGQRTFYLEGAKTVVSVDGDFKVRYWKL